MWDDKIHYNRLLKEDIFLKSFFKYFIEDKPSVYLYTYKFYEKDENLKEYLIEEYSIPLKIEKKKNLYGFLKSQSDIIFFLSKIWILRYQHWLIIFFFTYSNNTSKLTYIYDEDDESSFIGDDSSYNYSVGFHKLKFDNLYFSRNLKKKFIF
jgi:hypothetical protein